MTGGQLRGATPWAFHGARLVSYALAGAVAAAKMNIPIAHVEAAWCAHCDFTPAEFGAFRVALTGRDALVIADGAWPIDFARTQFAGMTLLRTVEITRFGQPVTEYEIWLGSDYRPTE